MSVHLNNLLGLEAPHKYQCKVWGYVIGHSQMLLEVHPASEYDNRFYLLFSDVLYFEGPMRWDNVNLRLGTNEEREAIYVRLYGPKLDDIRLALEQTHHLYVFDGTGLPVRIIASGSYLSRSSAPPLRCEFSDLQWERLYPLSTK
jgi:hypothetical protein